MDLSPPAACGRLICSHSDALGEPWEILFSLLLRTLPVELTSGRSIDWADAKPELATSPQSAQPGW